MRLMYNLISKNNIPMYYPILNFYFYTNGTCKACKKKKKT